MRCQPQPPFFIVLGANGNYSLCVLQQFFFSFFSVNSPSAGSSERLLRKAFAVFFVFNKTGMMGEMEEKRGYKRREMVGCYIFLGFPIFFL